MDASRIDGFIGAYNDHVAICVDAENDKFVDAWPLKTNGVRIQNLYDFEHHNQSHDVFFSCSSKKSTTRR
jgi:hypothetical protein